MKHAPLPSSRLAGIALPMAIVPAGTQLVRIHGPAKALFFGPGTRTRARNRFDSVDGAFGTCYLAESTRGAFAETFLREGRVRLVTEAQLKEREWSVIEVVQDLSLVSDMPDGARYRSRHNDDELCIALFDRASTKVRVAATLPLLDPSTGVIEVIDAYDVAVI